MLTTGDYGSTGKIAFDRSLFRFDPSGSELSTSALSHTFQFDIVAHEACWRAALAESVTRWPNLWEPAEPEAIRRIEGLGSYSWYTGNLTDPKWETMGYSVNWDLSGRFFPYMGQFLPPVAPETEWSNDRQGTQVRRAPLAIVFASPVSRSYTNLSSDRRDNVNFIAKCLFSLGCPSKNLTT